MALRKPTLYPKLASIVIEKLDLRSSASKAMVGIEIMLSLFFVIVILSFLLYDVVTVFYPPREKRASEALIIGSMVFAISLLAIYGRERLEKSFTHRAQGTQQNQAGIWVWGAILLVFIITIIFKPPPQQSQMLIRILGSIFGGLISAFFLGSLKITGHLPSLKKIQISAVGGFAIFCLIFFSWR